MEETYRMSKHLKSQGNRTMPDGGRERERGRLIGSNQLQEHPLDQLTTYALRHDRYDMMMLNDKQLLHVR